MDRWGGYVGVCGLGWVGRLDGVCGLVFVGVVIVLFYLVLWTSEEEKKCKRNPLQAQILNSQR